MGDNRESGRKREKRNTEKGREESKSSVGIGKWPAS
jgi:hypothetical protein